MQAFLFLLASTADTWLTVKLNLDLLGRELRTEIHKFMNKNKERKMWVCEGRRRRWWIRSVVLSHGNPAWGLLWSLAGRVPEDANSGPRTHPPPPLHFQSSLHNFDLLWPHCKLFFCPPPIIKGCTADREQVNCLPAAVKIAVSLGVSLRALIPHIWTQYLFNALSVPVRVQRKFTRPSSDISERFSFSGLLLLLW